MSSYFKVLSALTDSKDATLRNLEASEPSNIAYLVTWMCQLLFFCEALKIGLILQHELVLEIHLVSFLLDVKLSQTINNKLFVLLLVVGLITIVVDERQLKVCNVYAFEANLKHCKSLALWKDHQQSLECLEKVSVFWRLLHHLNPNVNKRRRFKQLYDCSYLYELFRIKVVSKLA